MTAELVRDWISGSSRVVIVNAEPTPFDDVADAVLRGPIGEILPDICAD
jgi:NAD-dependent deacetylase